MEMIQAINYSVAVAFFLCYLYQLVYILIPYIKKEKPHKEAKPHRYAILISARNEEEVIGQLISSIQNQTYSANLIDIFVVADNCTDNTAAVATRAGVYVYERFNTEQVGKGYALDFLLDRIGDEYGDEYDGYFVFDADNLLDENYISEMNKAFSDGHAIVTSYRNSKNYASNWISAGYSLWFLRESRFLNNSRMLLGTSCVVSGTGFLFSREILKKCGGWKFFLLTEDIEFTVHSVLNGERIAYCGSAVLYDEQPVQFSQSWTQRMRWARGYLQVFRKYGVKLIKGIFSKKGFACYDMTMSIMPAIVLTMFSTVVNGIAAVIGMFSGENILALAGSAWESILNAYLMMFAVGLITTLSEWKQIHCSIHKKVLYLFTFPLFMLTYIPISVVALFKRVEWKPIRHMEAKTLSEVRGR